MAVADDFANDIATALNALSDTDKADPDKVWAALYDVFDEYFGSQSVAVYSD